MKYLPIYKDDRKAIVDDHLFPALKAMGTWVLWNEYPAVAIRGESRHACLHHIVLSMHGVVNTNIVDHINGNELDNRFENLRVTNHSVNTQKGRFKVGATGFRGVTLRSDLKSKPYRATIKVAGKTKRLGYFATAEEAARAYDSAALEHFGVLAYFNFPRSETLSAENTSTFGYSYHFDMYDCVEGVCDDLPKHYRFLERLVDALRMDRMSAPYVIHGPRRHDKELYPDKAGVSGWIPLIQSGISIHSIEPTHFSTLDVYSCQCFKPQTVIDVALPVFRFKKYEEHFIERGTRYLTPVTE